MKKKIIGVVLSAILIGAMVVGCGSSGSTTGTSTDSSSGSASSSSTKTTKKVAMCMSHQSNDFQITITTAAKAKGEELGIEVVVFDGNNDSATQISQIESAINQGYDGIMFEPINVDAVTGVVEEANAAGIPIINVVGAMTDWEKHVAAYSGGDNVTAGELEMEKVAELIGGKGNICILNGPMGSDPQVQRHEGYDNVLAKYPDIKVIYEEDAAWATDKAMTITENWLQTGQEIAAIICQNDGEAVGAGKAVKDSGKSGIVITGVDATSDGIAAIQAGTITGTVSQNAAAQGENGVELMSKLLNGEKLTETDVRTDNIWIDSSNVAQYAK